MSFITSLIDWTNRTFAGYGPWGLFIVAFMESVFFPIPPDLLLITLSLASPDKAVLFALIATVGSVLGAMFAYLIGYLGEEIILKKFFKKEKIEKVHNLFNKYEAGAIFISALTPLPNKLFNIAAGVFYINFKKFVVAFAIGMGLRLFAEGVLLFFFGEVILEFLNKYFNIATIIVVIILVVIFIIYKKRKKKTISS